MKREKGFTLIELMVVIVIIGILSAVALPKFMVNQRKAKEGSGWADLDSLTTACEIYYLDHDEYPDGADGKTTIPTGTNGLYFMDHTSGSSWGGPYMKFRQSGAEGPQDAWGNYYYYEADAIDGAKVYTIWCKGGVYATGSEYSATYIKKGWFKSP